MLSKIAANGRLHFLTGHSLVAPTIAYAPTTLAPELAAKHEREARIRSEGEIAAYQMLAQDYRAAKGAGSSSSGAGSGSALV